jgi:hypothetical protein
VKRFVALLAGGLGLGALLRRRRRQPALSPSPASDLRARLDEAKTTEPVSAVPAAPAEDEDARRADVHARARQAIEDLGEPRD